MVFSDPPYNVPIQGHVTTQARHREFAMASGEMTSQEFGNRQILREILQGLLEFGLMRSLNIPSQEFPVLYCPWRALDW